VKQAFHTILGLALSLDAKSLWLTYNASNCSILSVLWLGPCVELPLGHRVRVWTKQTGVLLTGQPIIYLHVTTFTVACNYANIAPLHKKCHKRISCSSATCISHQIRVKRKPATTSRHLYEIAEKTPQKHFEGSCCVNSGQTKQAPQNECSHNLVSIIHRVSDHHLHHDILAGITPYWFDHFLMVGVDKCNKMLKVQEWSCRICILSFCHTSRSKGKSLMMSASTQKAWLIRKSQKHPHSSCIKFVLEASF
jgi:hypothetical protein